MTDFPAVGFKFQLQVHVFVNIQIFHDESCCLWSKHLTESFAINSFLSVSLVKFLRRFFEVLLNPSRKFNRVSTCLHLLARYVSTYFSRINDSDMLRLFENLNRNINSSVNDKQLFSIIFAWFVSHNVLNYDQFLNERSGFSPENKLMNGWYLK